jgi:hypothetical protein
MVKGEFVRDHVMKAYRRRGMSPLFLNLYTRRR